MNDFEKWSHEFSRQNLYAFNVDAMGMLWLKVRAVCRGRQLAEFTRANGIVLNSKTLARKNEELFLLLAVMPDAKIRLDSFLRQTSHEWYKEMNVDEQHLRDDLYKVHDYNWGGDRNNSLDKYLVSRYVKVVSDYDTLMARQPEIADNAWRYVQTSWYNNWTSYLIESLFKRHEKVVSAVGEIKSVDFFVEDCPIDLKVTFFPHEYMEAKLRHELGSSRTTWLRREAKKHGIDVPHDTTSAQEAYTLTERLAENGCHDTLATLAKAQEKIVREAQSSPLELMTWLYEQQGEMRFGAENLLFLVLADISDMSQSWKMKRAFSLIEPQVKKYLDNFRPQTLQRISFAFRGETYTSLADALFVIKN